MLQRRLAELERRVESRPVDMPGGGGDDSGMEARVAKLEATVEHIQQNTQDIKTDIRSIRNWGFTMFILTWGGLLALATLGLQRFDKVMDTLNQIATKLP